ncbi:hypothetical protein C1645_811500 [Glomus cerebriforme]|uniref:Uncharacterized protein n=1 Tax=Glomus cerebriforme TaxID=658196 RepID=A0A397TX89_9GLOM|nr:hypothetical protein C1645_811500 [Glomus cerebriforme]
MSTQSKLNNFLNLMDYENIHRLPYNNNAQILAAHARNSRKRLTGRGLIKQNIKREAHRLQLYKTHRLQLYKARRLQLYSRLYSRHMINLATNHIWEHSTSFQRNQFINLANNANNINNIRLTDNVSTIDRIARITTRQITNNTLENDFFNGAGNFNDNNNSLESLILPAGCLGSSSSFP